MNAQSNLLSNRNTKETIICGQNSRDDSFKRYRSVWTIFIRRRTGTILYLNSFNISNYDYANYF